MDESNVLDYEFSCIFERYRDLPSVLLPQTKLRVYNVFLRRSYNKIVINFDGNDETIGPQVFRFLADRYFDLFPTDSF